MVAIIVRDVPSSAGSGIEAMFSVGLVRTAPVVTSRDERIRGKTSRSVAVPRPGAASSITTTRHRRPDENARTLRLGDVADTGRRTNPGLMYLLKLANTKNRFVGWIR
jgi:hypothetical protein